MSADEGATPYEEPADDDEADGSNQDRRAVAAGARSLAEQMRAGGFRTLGEMMAAQDGGSE